MRALTTTLLLLFAATAGAQADHLQCFKIKDTVAKVKYTANLTPTDTNFPVANGCIVKVPAKLLCVDVQKAIVVGSPPGAGAGRSRAQVPLLQGQVSEDDADGDGAGPVRDAPGEGEGDEPPLRA